MNYRTEAKRRLIFETFWGREEAPLTYETVRYILGTGLPGRPQYWLVRNVWDELVDRQWYEAEWRASREVQIYWEMDRRPLRWTMGPTYGWDEWYEFEGQYLYQGALENFDPWEDPNVE